MDSIHERPIPFSAAMVAAILDGRKTQTRRVVKPQPVRLDDGMFGEMWEWNGDQGMRDCLAVLMESRCPYGQPRDRLWIKCPYSVAYDAKRDESRWMVDKHWVTTHGKPRRADGKLMKLGGKPGMFMPKWLSDGLLPPLEVVAVLAERLQEISENECIAEGCCGSYEEEDIELPSHKFRDLWDSINAKRGYPWDSNPWVWVVEFEKQEN